MKKSNLYVAKMVLAGFLIPIIPRVVVPLIFPLGLPGRQYRDTFGFLLQNPLWTLGICTWSAIPFVVLVFWIKENIIKAKLELLERNRRVAGVFGAFALTFAVGFLNNVPQTSGGVNFGMFLFTIYAIPVMPLGYFLGRVILSRYLS